MAEFNFGFAPPQIKPPNHWVKAVCIDVTDSYSEKNWPNYFYFPPREGDFVEAQDGSSLKIIQVTHAYENGEPIVYLKLGRDMTSASPSGGSGGSGTIIEG